jgi:hypothetical protein
MSRTAVQLSTGAMIEIQSNYPFIGRPGVSEASPLERLAEQDWKGVMQRVAELANEAIASLREAIKPCKEVSIEFGISVGGKTGVILVEGTANANFKVSLKW